MKIDKRKYDIALARLCADSRDVATKSGINPGTLSKVIAGQIRKPETIGRIAAALECDVTEIIE